MVLAEIYIGVQAKTERFVSDLPWRTVGLDANIPVY
jgi:ElaB/YqjD/DUF883 family membrane-anchored ribosome-binding protein